MAAVQKKYDTGATDTAIQTGNIMPQLEPASAHGIIGKTMSACRTITDNGDINGHRINLISYEDARRPETMSQPAKPMFPIFSPFPT